MRVIWLILLITSSPLFSQTLTIDEDFIRTMSGAYQTNYEDANRTLTPEMLLKNTSLQPYPKQFANYSKSIFWTHFDLKNISDKHAAIVLRNLRAGTDFIDISLYRNGEFLETILLGDQRSQNERSMLSTKSTFYIALDPGETITVVSRFECFGSYDLEWEVLSTRHYSKTNSFELWFWGVFGGLIGALILYNFIMYLSLKKHIFLVYVIHSTLLLWFQYAYNGVLFFLNTGINLFALTLSTWSVPYLTLSALGLFILLFFEFTKHNQFLTYLIGALIFLNSAATLLLCYAFINTDLLLYSNYFLLFAFITLVVYLFIGVYAVYHRYHGAWYNLFGQGTYIASTMFLVFVLAGQTPAGYMTYVIPASILVEMFAFSLALGTWVKKLRIKHEKTERLMMDEARFVSIGKNIGMAVHQWKDPLSQLGSHIVYLKAKEYQGDIFPQEVKHHIEEMEQLIEHMKQTINDLYESCTDIQSVCNFNLEKAIKLALNFSHDHLVLANVRVQTELAEEIVLMGSKNALINVLRILIDNAFDQFQKRVILHPSIIIKTVKTPKSTTIVFEDNGGGIGIFPIKNIFDIDISTKGSKGTGMGLALAKLLVEKQLNGTITAINTTQGARFEIVILTYL